MNNTIKSYNYFCQDCNYKTNNKRDFTRHNKTFKHLVQTKQIYVKPKTISDNLIDSSNSDIGNLYIPKTKNFKYEKYHICICNKSYKHASSLWNHKQKCILFINSLKETSYDNNHDDTNYHYKQQNDNNNNSNTLISLLSAQNTQLQNQVIELLKNGTHHNHNIVNNTSKTFNINLFLNETCKNAMNIGEFISDVKIKLKDIDYLGEEGYVKGVSNIIIKQLENIDITKRPVHCSDFKRETLYIKEKDQWTKDDEKKEKMHKMIRDISQKNLHSLDEWKNAHPNHSDSDSIYNDKYNKIIYASCDQSKENDDKIIKNITKEIKIV